MSSSLARNHRRTFISIAFRSILLRLIIPRLISFAGGRASPATTAPNLARPAHSNDGENPRVLHSSSQEDVPHSSPNDPSTELLCRFRRELEIASKAKTPEQLFGAPLGGGAPLSGGEHNAAALKLPPRSQSIFYTQESFPEVTTDPQRRPPELLDLLPLTVPPELVPLTAPPETRSCAVVGSSGVLALRSFGGEIDGHDVVIRLNGAMAGAGDDLLTRIAGSRTTIRVVNGWHVSSNKPWVYGVPGGRKIRQGFFSKEKVLSRFPRREVRGDEVLHWRNRQRVGDVLIGTLPRFAYKEAGYFADFSRFNTYFGPYFELRRKDVKLYQRISDLPSMPAGGDGGWNSEAHVRAGGGLGVDRARVCAAGEVDPEFGQFDGSVGAGESSSLDTCELSRTWTLDSVWQRWPARAWERERRRKRRSVSSAQRPPQSQIDVESRRLPYLLLTDTLITALENFLEDHRNSGPSTGGLGVALALYLCDSVTLYGFDWLETSTPSSESSAKNIVEETSAHYWDGVVDKMRRREMKEAHPVGAEGRRWKEMFVAGGTEGWGRLVGLGGDRGGSKCSRDEEDHAVAEVAEEATNNIHGGEV